MNKLLKISVMRLSKLRLLVIGACLIACGRDSGPSWQRFALSGFSDFECPVALKEDPRSGKGEDKWSFYYSRDDGTLNVAVSGFFHIPDYDRTEGESKCEKTGYYKKKKVDRVPFLGDGPSWPRLDTLPIRWFRLRTTTAFLGWLSGGWRL
ncbi:hypothetical protein, partial [Verrucomicrobium spinosum]|uniref:hypothetical protein n=1 Tax=Verrucomicrobium spinosum TaxID=2736 RepID=UPI000AE40CD8